MLNQDFKVNYSFISKMVCAHYRLGNKAYNSNNVVLIIMYKFLKIFIKLYSSADIHPKAQIGKNLRLEHDSNGIVIHSSAKIGNNARIFHQSTIGVKEEPIAANIGDNVMIGVGAKIIGNISIGDNVKIGANSVVTKNIETNKTVVGIPAKTIN